MTFYIEKIVLWLKSGNTRELTFENDKINVITGNSKTGKTAILEIIDYCLFGSESTISEEKIGTNVLWYGLKFHINNKIYTIARGKYNNIKNLSKEYFFSSTGDIPKKPSATINEKNLKEILEKEFSINGNVVFPYGGKEIKKDSQISFRYFLLFNTQSGDIINNSKEYFDKLHNPRYKEALNRIFDLALNISTIENIILKEEIKSIENKISKYSKEKEKIQDSIENHDIQLKCIIKKAKDNKLISSSLEDDKECIKLLQDIFETGRLPDIDIIENGKYQKLQDEKQVLEIKIRKLERYKSSIEQYRVKLKETADSLSPVNYIIENFSSNITNEEYLQFLTNLGDELKNIKNEIKKKQPFEYDINDKIKQLKQKVKLISQKINITPNVDDKEQVAAQRLMLAGSLQNELTQLLNQNFDTTEIDEKINNAVEKCNEMKSKYIDESKNRETTIEALNEYIQVYINIAEKALGEYGNYKSDFDYEKKVLRLRKPKATVPANITSSSDHLFMHLCLFLGMHQLIIDNQNPYVLPFLILDQPSRPYFNNNNFDYNESQLNVNEVNDWSKVKRICGLLNSFINNILIEHKHFQIILLEHISPDAWENCENINLIEIFDGTNNALIPLEEASQ